MRLLSWNMSGPMIAGGGRERHEAAWHWVAASMPDVALLQQAIAPAWAHDRWTILGDSTSPGDFGSLIVARPDAGVRPSQLKPETSARGVLATAGELALSDGTPLVLVSLYAEDPRAAAPSGRGVLESWGVVLAERRFVLGADLTSARYAGPLDASAASATGFEACVPDGWVELSVDEAGGEGATWLGTRSGAPFQPDHVFADGTTADHRTSFAIDASPATSLALSDHAVVVLDLELELPAAAADLEYDPDAAPFRERYLKARWLGNTESAARSSSGQGDQ